jgi:lipopolysaccharide biosynthesis glycosyltransferase
MNMIHVVCAIDNAYIAHCGVMLVSLFENNRSANFYIHIISTGLEEKEFAKLKKLISNYRHAYKSYFFDAGLLEGAPVSGHVSLSTYYRVLIPELLPETVDKVLYLDSDIIIRHNISALWETDINNLHLAAARELVTEEHKKSLEIPDEFCYFNAGILLMNLEKWREEQTSKKVIAFIGQNAQKLVFWDQDALNANLFNSCKILPSQWNVTAGFFSQEVEKYGLDAKEVKQVCENPYIIHFTGTEKPWKYFSNPPFKDDYFFYRKKTVWKNQLSEGELSRYQKFRIALSNFKRRFLGL